MPPPNDPPSNNPSLPPNGGNEAFGNAQKIAYSPTSARIPEKVARGVTATGAFVFMGPNEFIVDFLQFLARPPQLAARVIMSPPVAEHFLAGLRENLMRYEQAYGKAPCLPKSQAEKPRSAQDIYDDLKLPEEQLAGIYANGFLIGHSPAEFGLDFITNFFPSAIVTARVYLAIPRVGQLVETLTNMVNQWHRQKQTIQFLNPSTNLPPQPPQSPPDLGNPPTGPNSGPPNGPGNGPMPNIPPAGGPGWPLI